MKLELEKYFNTRTDISCTEDEFYGLIPLLNEMIKKLGIQTGKWRTNHRDNIKCRMAEIGYIHMDDGSFGENKKLIPNNNVLSAKLFLVSEVVDNYEIY